MEVADAPEAWQKAGFGVVDDRIVLDGVEFRLSGSDHAEVDDANRGIRGWHVDGMTDASLDGLAACEGPSTGTSAEIEHPNGVSGIDHLVIATPNLPRTIAAFEDAGIEARRTRTFRLGDTERQQTFFWAGSTIIEMVGVVGEQGSGSASFWGLALVSEDLDATAASLDGLISPPKEAIQPGRRIATLDTRALNISVPIAVMTPHAKRGQQVAPITK